MGLKGGYWRLGYDDRLRDRGTKVQQSSDVTYRIYDYNRVGLDGKPRELHTELAAQALNYQVEDEYRSQGLRHAGVKSAYYY